MLRNAERRRSACIGGSAKRSLVPKGYTVSPIETLAVLLVTMLASMVRMVKPGK
jgi:hypothetical protein